MHRSWPERCRHALGAPHWRRTFLVLAAVLLLVQTGFPAHQDSHPIGSQDNLCQYCVMAGHAFGVPGVAVLALPPASHTEYTPAKLVEFHIPPFPRTRFSRAPPV